MGRKQKFHPITKTLTPEQRSAINKLKTSWGNYGNLLQQTVTDECLMKDFAGFYKKRITKDMIPKEQGWSWNQSNSRVKVELSLPPLNCSAMKIKNNDLVVTLFKINPRIMKNRLSKVSYKMWIFHIHEAKAGSTEKFLVSFLWSEKGKEPTPSEIDSHMLISSNNCENWIAMMMNGSKTHHQHHQNNNHHPHHYSGSNSSSIGYSDSGSGDDQYPPIPQINYRHHHHPQYRLQQQQQYDDDDRINNQTIDPTLNFENDTMMTMMPPYPSYLFDVKPDCKLGDSKESKDHTSTNVTLEDLTFLREFMTKEVGDTIFGCELY